MSSYIRKLSYLYYYENRQRGVNAGYVKLERRDTAIRFQMNIRFRVMDDMPLMLYLYGKQKSGRWILIPLGNCQMKNRQLIMRFIKKENEVLPDGIGIENIFGVFLPLKGNRCFAGSWNDRDAGEYLRFMDWVGTKETREISEGLKEESLQESYDVSKPDEEILKDISDVSKPTDNVDQGDEDINAKISLNASNEPEEMSEKGAESFNSMSKDEANTVKTEGEFSKEEDYSSSEMQSMEWTPPEQAKDWLPVWEEKITPELVFSVYPSLPEFLFCKKCLRIEPQDIGILPMESWFLAGNSFLLHGYYNFNHLLLGWKTDKPEAFILGVPGIYDRREKIMAGMFGFESFEIMGRRNPDKSPIPEGAMGYWYRRIEPSLRQENK